MGGRCGHRMTALRGEDMEGADRGRGVVSEIAGASAGGGARTSAVLRAQGPPAPTTTTVPTDR